MILKFSGDNECQSQLKDSMIPVLQRIHTDIVNSNVVNLPIYILPSIQLFASKYLRYAINVYLSILWNSDTALLCPTV